MKSCFPFNKRDFFAFFFVQIHIPKLIKKNLFSFTPTLFINNNEVNKIYITKRCNVVNKFENDLLDLQQCLFKKKLLYNLVNTYV